MPIAALDPPRPYWNMAFSALKLRGIQLKLDELISDAETQKVSFLGFLNQLLLCEMDDRAERRYRRNIAAAHFPVVKTLEDFEYGRVKGVTKSQIAQLQDFSWIDKHENLLFFGPPGLGKTHLAIALGYEAIGKGYTVCFERISNQVKLLKTAEIQRTARRSDSPSGWMLMRPPRPMLAKPLGIIGAGASRLRGPPVGPEPGAERRPTRSLRHDALRREDRTLGGMPSRGRETSAGATSAERRGR